MKAIKLPPVIDQAFRAGKDINEVNGGYHFDVHLTSGLTLSGLPEYPSAEGVLVLDDSQDEMKLIDFATIAAITVRVVA